MAVNKLAGLVRHQRTPALTLCRKESLPDAGGRITVASSHSADAGYGISVARNHSADAGCSMAQDLNEYSNRQYNVCQCVHTCPSSALQLCAYIDTMLGDPELTRVGNLSVT